MRDDMTEMAEAIASTRPAAERVEPAIVKILPGILHRCSDCRRRYLMVPGRAVLEPPRCECGQELTATTLPSGMYEMRASHPPAVSAGTPRTPAPASRRAKPTAPKRRR